MTEPLIIVGADPAGVCDVETGICAPAPADPPTAQDPTAEDPTVAAAPTEPARG